MFFTMNAQDDNVLPYHQIPEAPENYEAGNVVSRMIDGLGFRFYWASKDLRTEDLEFAPSDDARNAIETLEHIYGLSETIYNAAKNEPNIRLANRSKMTYEELREGTLVNLKNASDIMRSKTAEEVTELKVMFKRGDNVSEFPFWNMINGPIADALNHTGQILSFRRSSGNPIQRGVNVFSGTVKGQ